MEGQRFISRTWYGRRHTFHIVNNSPWPILLSFGLFSFIISTVCLLHGYNGVSLDEYLFQFFLIVFIMGLWWRDVIREGFFEGCHTMAVMYSLRLGMVLFIVSEVMFFVAFFWAFFHSSLIPAVQIGGIWPPFLYPVIEPYAIPFFNTIVLVFSGLTLTLAHVIFLSHEDIRKNGLYKYVNVLYVDKPYDSLIDVLFFFVLTILLAFLFTLLQLTEYRLANFSISDGIYGTVFYMATGFHGFHVIVGTIFLIVAAFRCAAGQFSVYHHINFEAGAWYWHFVDVVWLFLYVTMYWWGSSH
jgi:heme/copper-type cytochrome/quinol oxidase subunit 3